MWVCPISSSHPVWEIWTLRPPSTTNSPGAFQCTASLIRATRSLIFHQGTWPASNMNTSTMRHAYGFREGISLIIKNMLLWFSDNYKYYTVKRHNFSKSHGSSTDSGFLFFLQPGGVGGVWNSISHVAAAGLLWRSKCVAFLRAWGRPKLCWSVLLANHLEVKNGSAALPSTKHLQIQFFGIWLDYGIMISKKHI